MQQQRPHEQRITCGSAAQNLSAVAAQLPDLFGREPSQAVGAREHAERAVVFIAVVQVQPDRDHPLQDFDRRLNVRHAILNALGTEPLHIRLGAHGDGQVLVPGHWPVGVGRLGEEDCPHRPRFSRDQRMNQLRQASRAGQIGNARHREQAATTGTRNIAERFDKLVNLG
jgi:hypothetical protein